MAKKFDSYNKFLKIKNGSARIKFDEFNQRIKILSFKGDLEG